MFVYLTDCLMVFLFRFFVKFDEMNRSVASEENKPI